MTDMPGWVPPKTLEELLRGVFVPPSLYVRGRAQRELRKGEAELRLIPFLVPEGKRAIDAGANVGIWSYWLSRRASTVEAFEPNPKIFAILSKAALPRVTCHPTALSDTDGVARLLVPKGERGYSNQGASLSTVKVAGEHGVVEVATKRLDAFGFSDVGFIKIDVEGFELAVVEGARDTLARTRPSLVIEMEEKHARQPIEQLLAAVEAHGYEAFALCRGVLTRAAHIDFDAHHRRPTIPQDYIFNFIFLPR